MSKKPSIFLKWLRRLFLLGIAIVLLVGIVIGFCNLSVSNSAKNRTYNTVADIPYRKVGVVLGTTPRTKSGSENYFFKARMEAAAELYFSHKISYILVSGDNHVKYYNEPVAMQQSLIAMGVPESDIFLDYAGFRTYDSMVRAKKVFGQDAVTVISQSWHNKRAIYIARHRDLDAIAYNAKDTKVRTSYIRMHLREALSRVKAVFDVLTNKQPKFLGEPVVIP